MAAPALSVEERIAEAVVARMQPQIDALRAALDRLQGGGPELVLMPEAARRLGVDVRSVQRWAKNGTIEVVPVGGVRMVRLPGPTGQK